MPSYLSATELPQKSEDVRFARPCRNQGAVLRSFGTYKEKGLLLPHSGIEFAVPAETRLTSCAQGIIRHIGPMPSLGIMVLIEHGGGYHTVMAPFAKSSLLVEVGQAVQQGQTLGVVGESALGEPTFLHLELRQNREAIDPSVLLE